MSDALKRIIDEVIRKEGGYVDNPNDRGGKTNWGITEAVARANFYKGDMRDLPRDVAFGIYWKQYVLAPRFDKIAALSQMVAAECVDTGVNMGVMWGGLFLQQALNAFNEQGKLWPDLKEDGDCGEATRGALAAYLAHPRRKDPAILVRAMDCLQGARYIELSQRRQANESFAFGWIANRVA